jgi:hypothetical protein
MEYRVDISRNEICFRLCGYGGRKDQDQGKNKLDNSLYLVPILVSENVIFLSCIKKYSNSVTP